MLGNEGALVRAHGVGAARRWSGRRILAVVLLAPAVLFGVLFGTAAASQAAGSDGATPYVVDAAGITLPDGQTFQAHGHVNIRWANADGSTGSAGIHFDPYNNQPGGVWIGQSFIPWSAFGVPGDACIIWVQVAGFNEHFGEGGQPPVCLGTEEPTEEPTTEEPTTEQPTTEQPTTEQPTTEQPTTQDPSTVTPTVAGASAERELNETGTATEVSGTAESSVAQDTLASTGLGDRVPQVVGLAAMLTAAGAVLVLLVRRRHAR